jgi:hypothetical protein
MALKRPDERKRCADRVRNLLAFGDFRHLEVRGQGAHIVIGAPDDPCARLTALGPDTFGLAFRGTHGGWDPMLVVDTLDEIVHDMTAAMGSAA